MNVASWRAAYQDILSAEKLASLDEAELEREWLEHVMHPPQEQRLFVLEDQAEVIGYSRTGRNLDAALDRQHIPEVYGFYVSPGIWGRGAGRFLMDHVLDDFRERGFAAATLWVVEGNKRARGFYERVGWTVDPGATNTCFGAPEVRYRIRL